MFIYIPPRVYLLILTWVCIKVCILYNTILMWVFKFNRWTYWKKNIKYRWYVCVHAQSLQSCPVVCNPMHSRSKNTGVGCHALLQGIFLTQGSNPCLLCLLHYRWILYPWSHLGNTLPHTHFHLTDVPSTGDKNDNFNPAKVIKLMQKLLKFGKACENIHRYNSIFSWTA